MGPHSVSVTNKLTDSRVKYEIYKRQPDVMCRKKPEALIFYVFFFFAYEVRNEIALARCNYIFPLLTVKQNQIPTSLIETKYSRPFHKHTF